MSRVVASYTKGKIKGGFTMLKKISVFLLLALCVVSVVVSFGVLEVGAEGKGITEQIKGSSGNGVDDVTNKISESGASIYDAAKEISLTGAVLSLVVAGFVFKFMGGNSTALQGAKSKIMWIFVGLFVVFGAISIIATFLQWLGWEVK